MVVLGRFSGGNIDEPVRVFGALHDVTRQRPLDVDQEHPGSGVEALLGEVPEVDRFAEPGCPDDVNAPHVLCVDP
ncbi:MAG: hypothetical protein M3Q71_08460 [Chloroflexota bacterium]|nr:hypothetical protein [Chloroflexota bacterium]